MLLFAGLFERLLRAKMITMKTTINKKPPPAAPATRGIGKVLPLEEDVSAFTSSVVVAGRLDVVGDSVAAGVVLEVVATVVDYFVVVVVLVVVVVGPTM